jgi:hypothetical protein
MSFRPFFRNHMSFQSKYWILLFASIHFLLHLILFLYSFSGIMRQFDSDEAATLIEEICWITVHILQFPVVTTFQVMWPPGPLPSVLQHVPFILNSGLWGALLWLSLRRYIKKIYSTDKNW